MKNQDKAGVQLWNGWWASEPRMRLPKACTTTIRDRMGLLREEVRPGMKFLEIGCAPGKLLAWTAGVLGAKVAGLDYSEPGVAVTRKLFQELRLPGDIRCEDVFATSFEPNSFDVVYSGGVIEHFEDPTEIVRIHTRLVRPGGLALITVPNLRSIYGRIASKEMLAIHNLDIMTPEALRRLAPSDLTASAEAYRYGRFTLAQGAIDDRWGILSRLIRTGSDLVGLVQPFRVDALCPTLVLKIRRI